MYSEYPGRPTQASTNTGSPIEKPVTPSPICSTVPNPSSPMSNGSSRPCENNRPAVEFTSVALTPAKWFLTRTCPELGGSNGNSTTLVASAKFEENWYTCNFLYVAI